MSASAGSGATGPPARRYPWRTAVLLIAAGTLTAPLVLPYAIGLTPAPADGTPAATPWVSLSLRMMLRSLVLLAPATLLGFLVAPRLGLGAPHLEHRLDGAPHPGRPWSADVGPALGWAAATAGIAFAIDAFFVNVLHVTFPAPEIHARISVAWWRSGLASLWAPFSEELFDRLFLMSLVAWLGVRLFRVGESARGRAVALGIANVGTALFFGVYHLSNEKLFAATVPPLVALRTVLIILPVGLAFGRLYQRRGIEAAILSHFAIDVIVHVVRPIAEHGLA